MKKRVNAVLLLLFVVVAGWGQIPESAPDDSAKKKEINSIKLQGDAFYSDKYHEIPADEAGIEEAHKRSKELLQAHVIEIFSKRLKMSREDVQDIWAVIEKNCQNIVVKRGDMFRVFTYVMKNAFNSGETATEKTTNEIVSPVSAAPASPVPATPAPQPAPQPVPQPAPQPEVKVDTVATSVPVPLVTPVPTPVLEPKPEPKPGPKPQPVPETVSSVEVPILCQTLISKGNFDKVYRYLMQEKTYQKLMYGTAKTMQYPEKCYIVLTDKTSGNIVAVLDKGVSERMNFITNKMDHFRNYEGGNFRAIFVQEY